MTAAATQTHTHTYKARTQIGEWFWRFLAAIMLVIVAWVVWIALQISPPDMVLPAAFEAAAQGRASRNSAGAVGAGPSQVAAVPTEAVVIPAPPPAEPAPAPVNLEKLKLSDSIATPIMDRPKRPAKPAAVAPQ